MAKLEEALDDFIDRQRRFLDVGAGCFEKWRSAVLYECSNRIANFRAFCDKSPLMVTDEVLKYLRFLHHHLVMVPVDKAANNVAFICKRLYVNTLLAELHSSSGAYQPVTETVDEILSHHRDVLQPLMLMGQPSLPYLYWLPKLHKSPFGSRFIAASARCSTTELSSMLSDLLNHVLSTLRDKDDKEIVRSGVRRFFVIQGYEEVAFSLSKWMRRDDGQSLYTGDFSTMYTAIPHADLLIQVRKALTEAWQYIVAEQRLGGLDSLLLCWAEDRVNWITPRRTESAHSEERHQWTLDGLMKAIAFLVHNVYLVNDEQCWRQDVGIPMGTNCAPALANLYLYAYESEFIDRLKVSQLKVAQEFHMSFRLIDDVLFVDNPTLRDYIDRPAEDGGIYPRALKLNETSINADEVNFLGMKIRSQGKSFRVDVFDKRTEFPFKVLRYPHTDSLIPDSIPYGVFTGQLHRYYRICSDKTDFLRNSQVLATTLQEQGCSKKRLCKYFHAFVSSRSRLRWKTTVADLCRLFNGRRRGARHCV
jgi:hypothetical protein